MKIFVEAAAALAKNGKQDLASKLLQASRLGPRKQGEYAVQIERTLKNARKDMFDYMDGVGYVLRYCYSLLKELGYQVRELPRAIKEWESLKEDAEFDRRVGSALDPQQGVLLGTESTEEGILSRVLGILEDVETSTHLADVPMRNLNIAISKISRWV